MSTDIQIQPAAPAIPVADTYQPRQIAVKSDGNIEVTAIPTEGDDMACNQKALILWCDRKIADLGGEKAELDDAAHTAKRRKWKSATLERHAGIAGRRIMFYEKMREALRAGYVLVPNFDGQVFAIRRSGDPSRSSFVEWDTGWTYRTPEQGAQSLPQGEGAYQNPFPVLKSKYIGVQKDQNGKDRTRWEFWADQWAEMEFPSSMAKARIIEATTAAMGLKVFDDFVITPAQAYRSKKQDPIILGRILGPKVGYTRKTVSFLLAWHIDTKAL